MPQTEFQETERIESPFARSSAAVARSSAAEPLRLFEVADAAPGAAASAASREPESAPAPSEATGPAAGAQRLRVRPPRRLTGLRPLTGYEEELIEDGARSTNTAALCNEILARCLVPLGEPSEGMASRVGELLVAERDAALVDLRRLTFGDRVETDVDCPGCGTATHVSFDLTQVSLEAPDVAEALEVRLTGGVSAQLRLPTAQDQADLMAARLVNLAERRTWLLGRVIQRLGNVAGPLAFETVHGLDSRTRHELERALEKEIPDLDLRVSAKCDACGRELEAPFEITSFFLPS